MKLFYEIYNNELGTDGLPIQMGKVNLYISMNNETDNKPLNHVINNQVVYWTIKNKEIKKTNKKLISSFIDEENPSNNLFIYRGETNE